MTKQSAFSTLRTQAGSRRSGGATAPGALETGLHTHAHVKVAEAGP